MTDGIESALEQANAAADGQTIGLGGRSIDRQFLEAGLVDELRIALEVIHTTTTIHMRFTVVRG